MPIKNLSNQRQMPRLGKIHTGIKKQSENGKTYPSAVDYFVVPTEIQAVFGEKPKELDVMFPVEDDTKFASQFYRRYSSLRGLVCKGDGDNCIRMIDTATGDFAHRDAKETVMRELPCTGQDCPSYKSKECKEVMMLQFLIPKVPGLGIWQLDTSSYHSIVAVNSAIELIKNVCGRVSMIPLKLTLEPRDAIIKTERGDVKKKVWTLQIRTGETLAEIQAVAARPTSQALLPPPADEEQPEMLYPELEQAEEVKVEPQPPPLVVKSSEKPTVAPTAEQAGQMVSQAKPKRDAATITTLGQLFTACYEDFNMSRGDVAKEAGYKGPDDLKGSNVKKLQEIYTAIAAVRG